MVLTYINPATLAETLDVSPLWVRDLLRANFHEQAPGKGGRWEVTHEMAMLVAALVADWRLQQIDLLFS